jgi:uncharacterized protein (DUF885 family)
LSAKQTFQKTASAIANRRGLCLATEVTSSNQFEQLLDGYFKSLLAEFPTFAADAGLAEGRGKLGRANLAFEKRWQSKRKAALAELNSLSPSTLSNAQHLDRLAFRSQLLRECEDFELGRHTRNPDALDHVLNALLHQLQRGEDEPRVVARHLRSLLKATPRYLAEAASLIDRPEKVWRTIMEQTAVGAASLFDAVAVFLKSAEAMPSDTASIIAAQQSFAKYHRQVMRRPLAPAGSFAIGDEIMQRRVRDQLGLDYSLDEIEALALSEIERVNSLLRAACKKIGRGKSPEKIIAESRAAWNPAGFFG